MELFMNGRMISIGVLFILMAISGCAATTQNLPIPTLARDPESSIIILNRQGTYGLARTVQVFDNGTFVGELGPNGVLKWSRKRGDVELVIKQDQRQINPLVFTVEHNKVYTLNLTYVTGIVKLEGNESSQMNFTSSPLGATIYAGPTRDSLKPLLIKTPRSLPYPVKTGKPTWAPEYYKMALAGYKESEVVFKNNSFGDRNVHFDLVPIQELPRESLTNPTKEVEKANPIKTVNESITISITSPEIDRGLRVIEKSANLTIAGNAKGGSGISEILVNGQQAALDDQGHFSAEVLLKPGENQITVSATDTQRKSNTRTFSITREIVKVVQKPEIEIKKPVATVTINTGKYHALIIAVQDYSSKEINNLDHPIADAIAIKNILTKRYTFDDKNIVFLKNPDRKTIETTFNDLRKKLSENDNLLIFYAGHGVWMDDMREGYWLPRDASGINNPTDWIPNSTIRNNIRALKAKHVLLVADACFSGGIFKVREAFTSPNASIEKIYEMQSRKAITSGSLKTVPDRSVFVEYFVKRLNENIEKYLDAQQLFVSFKEAVINNSPNNQTPLYGAISEAGDEGGDFVFVRRQQ
ncbi:caspase family protein [bacterium]|nr:MAG: caspase family protein [bacterium]